VFVAIDKSLGRKVVIKLLSPELTAEVNRGRFRREIQVAAQLQHPHIVPLLSAGEHEELVWFTMPFISGESLKSAVDKNGPLSVEDVVRVLYHVGEALDYAHGQGVVHRDIKPANILRSGTYALVTDFGVAKALNASMPSSGMTATGTAVGTPAYMAPEQLAGESTADHRIDIYALGLLAYELLKGKSPFSATSAQKVLVKVLTEDPEPLIKVRPDVPARLSEIVMHCLQKEPDDRPATARALLDELDSFSTASGEIRTMEHKIPRRERTPVTPFTPTPSTPVSSTPAVTPTTPTAPVPAALTPSQVPALAPTLAVEKQPRAETPTPVDDAAPIDDLAPGYTPQKKSNRGKIMVGAVAVAAVIAAGIFFSQSSGAKPPVVAPPPAPPPVGAPVADTTPILPAAPVVAPTTVPVAPNPDSLKIADSVKKAAKALAAKKAAAAKADSEQKAQQQQQAAVAFQATARQNAGRTAVRGMFANPEARAKFEDGATHKSGGLIKKTKGDLQTQIDALTPFLKGSGLTYEQFKSILSDAGIKAFDEFGRMIPAALQQYSGAAR
jgi:serine/threonine-protein kinase